MSKQSRDKMEKAHVWFAIILCIWMGGNNILLLTVAPKRLEYVMDVFQKFAVCFL